MPPPFTGSWRQRARTFFFGHDIFISYRRLDGSKYARSLFDELKKAYTIYADWRAALPGEKLPLEVTDALHRSSMLVVIGTPGALKSDHIATEIAMWRPGRAAVQIDISGVLEDAEKAGTLWPGIKGSPRVTEDAAVLEQANPRPSPEVIAFIDDCATFTKQESRLRRAVMVTIASITMLLAAGGGVGWWITTTTKEDVARVTAHGQIQQLRAKRETGNLKRAAAEAERAAQRATEERNRQSEIATAQQLATASSDLLRQEPQSVTTAASLAVQSVRRLSRIGLRKPETDSALRAAAAVLPIVKRRVVAWQDGRWSHEVSPVITRSGRFAAYMSGPREVSVADLTSRKTPRRFKFDGGDGDAKWVIQLGLSEDGSHVAACTSEHIWIWPERHVLDHGAYRLAFSADGRYLASESDGDVETTLLEVVESATGKQLRATTWPRDRNGPASRISLIDKGEALVLHEGSHPGMWRWRANAIDAAPNGTLKIEVSPADDTLALARVGDSIALWQWKKWNDATASPVWTTTILRARDVVFGGGSYELWIINDLGKVTRVRWTAFGNDYKIEDLPPAHAIAAAGEFVMIVAEDRTIRFYHGGNEIARSGEAPKPREQSERERQFRGLAAFAITDSIAVTADGYATWCSKIGVERWAKPPDVPRPVSVSTSGVHALSPDLSMSAAVGNPSSRLDVITSGRLPTTYSLPTTVTAIAFSPRGELLAGTWDGRVFVWRRPLNASSRPWHCVEHGFILSIAVSRSGRQVAIASGKAVSLYDLKNGVLRKRLRIQHPAVVRSVAFGANDALLATASDDNRLRLWSDTHPVREYSIAEVHEIVFGERDRYIAAVTNDTVAVWDTASASDHSVRIPVTGAKSIAFDPTGAFIASGSASVVIGWNWRTRAEIMRIPAGSEIAYVRFTPDGKALNVSARSALHAANRCVIY